MRATALCRPPGSPAPGLAPGCPPPSWAPPAWRWEEPAGADRPPAGLGPAEFGEAKPSQLPWSPAVCRPRRPPAVRATLARAVRGGNEVAAVPLWPWGDRTPRAVPGRQRRHAFLHRLAVDFIGPRRFRPGAIDIAQNCAGSIGCRPNFAVDQELEPLDAPAEHGSWRKQLRGSCQSQFGRRGRRNWHGMPMADRIDTRHQGWSMMGDASFIVSGRLLFSNPTRNREAQAWIVLRELGHTLGAHPSGLRAGEERRDAHLGPLRLERLPAQAGDARPLQPRLHRSHQAECVAAHEIGYWRPATRAPRPAPCLGPRSTICSSPDDQ